MLNVSKKIVVLILVFTFIFPPVFANKAEAQWAVIDPANLTENILKSVKEYGLDTLAWTISNMVIERIAASTVSWINSGFQGSPAYVTDPQAYFQKIADEEMGQFILDNPNLDQLCGPIKAKIRLALTQNYIREPIYRCTLTDVVGNIDGFMDDFSQGGWDGFFELTQKTQNNPIGAYLQAENDLDLRIASRQGVAQKELDWGGGFMSFKKCEIQGQDIVTPGFNPGDPDTVVHTCLKETTQTPGSVISNQLNNVLKLGNDKLKAADEINEIVSALLNQLVGSVVGGIGSGLRGLSKPDSSGGEKFTGKLTDKPGTVVGYFCFDSNDPTSEFYDTDPNTCRYPDTPNTDMLDRNVGQELDDIQRNSTWPGSDSSLEPECDPSDPNNDPNNLPPWCSH